MRLRTSGLLAVATLLSVAGPALVADATDPTTIAFRVVAPDGGLVPHPVVMVSVYGETFHDVTVLTGGALGEVVVPLPAGDPVARERLAAGEPVNLMVRVFDKAPGSEGINAAYVTASVGVDATGRLGELSDVTGRVFTVRPDRTAFVPVPVGTRIVPGVGEGTAPPDCVDPVPNGAPYVCRFVDYPSWAEHTEVPIAGNHGGGADMISRMRYNSTVVTQTGVAVQVGASGFFQADGSVAYQRETSTGLGFQPRGPHDSAVAYLDTVFQRERTGACYYVPLDREWQCQAEVHYRPFQAIGTVSETTQLAHDRLSPGPDCWTPIDQVYEPLEKSETTRAFGLQLGPNENWASIGERVLFANTTITQQTATKKGFVRSWSVASPRVFKFHYAWVPGGNIGRDHTNADQAACVAGQLGRALTHATQIKIEVMTEPVTDPVTEPAPTSSPAAPPPDETVRVVCGRQPDRCD